MPNYTGDGFDNIYVGDGSAETIIGNGGNDTLSGNGGDDIISGDAGADILSGGDGQDQLYSGSISAAWNRPYFGNPWTAPLLDTGSEHDTIDGGAGFDIIYAGYGDSVDGGLDSAGLLISFMGASSGVTVDFRTLTNGGSLTIGGGTLTNVNTIYWIEGSNFDDDIVDSDASGNFAPIFGGGGNDHIVAGYYTGDIHGGTGNDTIDRRASPYSFLIYGEDGNDTIYAGSSQQVYGGDGNDTIYDAIGFIVDGGSGTDTFSTLSYAIQSYVSISGFEILELRNGGTLNISASQFGSGFASNSLLRGSGLLKINMTSTDVELYLQQLTVAGGSNVSIEVVGSVNDDIIKGVLGAVNTIDGGDGADQIRGGQLGDIINGGNGDDKIFGANGADIMTGGAGADTFRFQTVSSSGVGAAADQITDFVIGTDRLAFTLIDADPVTPGDQAFAFLGTSAFTAGGTGQIRYMNSGANLLVQVDVDGNGTVDMEVVLQGLTGQTLTGASFLL